MPFLLLLRPSSVVSSFSCLARPFCWFLGGCTFCSGWLGCASVGPKKARASSIGTALGGDLAGESVPDGSRMSETVGASRVRVCCCCCCSGRRPRNFFHSTKLPRAPSSKGPPGAWHQGAPAFPRRGWQKERGKAPHVPGPGSINSTGFLHLIPAPASPFLRHSWDKRIHINWKKHHQGCPRQRLKGATRVNSSTAAITRVAEIQSIDLPKPIEPTELYKSLSLQLPHRGCPSPFGKQWVSWPGLYVSLFLLFSNSFIHLCFC